MIKEDEDVKFIDAEQWQGGNKEEITFKEIVLNQVQKISQNANVEFRGGYWISKPHPNPNMNTTIDEYCPDTREVYSNSIEFLYDLLYPHFDEEMLKSGKEYDLKLERAYKDNTVIKQPEREDESSEEAKKSRRSFVGDKSKVSFRTERVKLCRKLFRDMSCFLKRVDYFKSKSFEDDV